MKSKSNLSFLFNPFDKIAGIKALCIGLALFAISTVLAHLGGVVFSSIISAQLIPFNLAQAFIAHGVSLLVLILVMYVAGLIFSPSSIRLIDVAGTMTLSRAPFVIIGAMLSIPLVSSSWQKFVSVIFMPGMASESWVAPVFIGSMVIVFICVIWFVVLAYNAFSVSCNIKGMKNNIVFTASFLIALLICFLLFAKFSPVPLPSIVSDAQSSTENVSQQENYEVINGIAQQAAIDISEGKYDEVTVCFDDKMKEGLSPEKLAEVMKSVEARFGKMVKVGDEIKNERIGENRLVLVPVRFEKMELYFRFTFDGENRIVGFYM